VYFYLRVLFGRRWHRVALGFIPTAVFTWLLLAATILHWEKFHHGQFAFEAWFWIYVITPVLVPGTWLRNRGRDPGALDEHAVGLPRPVRLALIGSGVFLLTLAAVMFAWPAGVIRIWPWALTPLTARTVAGFIVLPGVSWLVMAADGPLERRAGGGGDGRHRRSSCW